MKRIIAAVLLFAILLTGCAEAAAAGDLMEGYVAQPISEEVVEPDVHPADFAVSLFQNSLTEGENMLVSPLSVLSALAMVANGAEGETLSQMEAVLGATPEQLNSWFHSYMSRLGEEDALHLANAIWFNTHERFTPDPDFLQTNADYFGAGIRSGEFDDALCREINKWVEEHTDGMIPEILDEIPEDAVMYLVNALAFEARWASTYREEQVRDGIFTTEDGREQEARLMHDTVFAYLELDNAAGFLRHYKDGYAFAALLPHAGVTVAELAASLEGEELTALLAQPQSVPVKTAIPKFQGESSLKLNEILANMGMGDAFDQERANLTGLGTSSRGNVYINKVLHKTFISVSEEGTRAGAATMVEANDRAMGVMVDQKEVILDRPFIYMIVDTETNLPIFMGTCMDLG